MELTEQQQENLLRGLGRACLYANMNMSIRAEQVQLQDIEKGYSPLYTIHTDNFATLEIHPNQLKTDQDFTDHSLRYDIAKHVRSQIYYMLREEK